MSRVREPCPEAVLARHTPRASPASRAPEPCSTRCSLCGEPCTAATPGINTSALPQVPLRSPLRGSHPTNQGTFIVPPVLFHTPHVRHGPLANLPQTRTRSVPQRSTVPSGRRYPYMCDNNRWLQCDNRSFGLIQDDIHIRVGTQSCQYLRCVWGI